MNKLALDIPGQDGNWGSYISKYPSDSNKIPANAFTINSRNIITSKSGQAEKIQGGSLWNPNSPLGSAPMDQYEGIFSDGTRLLLINVLGVIKASSGNNLFLTVQSGYSSQANFEFASYQDRIYGDNGIDPAQVFDIVTNYGGVPYVFGLAKAKAMGAQAPVTAPTVTLALDSTVNQVPAGAHTYKVTFVYYNGQEESNGGPASAPAVTNDATHTRNSLTAIPVGGYGVTARNIYRDNNDQDWLLLDTIPNNTATTYSDILPIGSTPTPIPTQNGLPPVFKYIANWLDRMFVAGIEGAPSSLYWSNAGQPDIFSPANLILCRNDDIITALFVFNGLLYVFGQHSVGVILGTTDNTFYYSPISTTVGCVDNRSIAVRSLVSVPTMIWLSALPNRGFYYTNGSTVQYLSEFIEDLTLNLSQVSFLERSNTQATQAAFQGDTSSPGIDLDSNPGAIQTINPRAFYGSAVAWVTGTISDLVLAGDQLQNILKFAPTAASGSIGGDLQVSGSNFSLPTQSDFTGESSAFSHDAGVVLSNGAIAAYAVAEPIIPPVTGNFTGAVFDMALDSHNTWTFAIWSDSFGSPGAVIFSTSLGVGTQNFANPISTHHYTVSCSVALTGGQKYYFGVYSNSSTDGFSAIYVLTGTTNFSGGHAVAEQHNTSIWSNAKILHQFGPFTTVDLPVINESYTFTKTPISDSGVWTSPVYDSLSDYVSGANMKLAIVGSYPTSCSATVQVQGSNNPLGPWTITDTLSSPNGASISLTGGPYRYWQMIVTLNTTDNRRTPTVSVPALSFNTAGAWTSPVIETTADITAFVSLIASVTSIGFSSFTIQIRTGPTNIGPFTAYTSLGSAVMDNFAQLRLTMNIDPISGGTAVASSVDFKWAIQSTIESTPIDTAANPPSGWGVFQYDSVGGGTVAFYFRTASTSIGLASATYILAPNGVIPTNAVLEFCQWKGIFTATPDNFPQINSVTVNWFTGQGSTTRCAAIFFNKSYYCAVASQGSTFNDLLIEFDYQGNWRIHSTFNISTIGTYFNDLYYGSSLGGDILNAFKQNTENGTNIILDLRTKCFNYGSNQNLKVVRSLKVTGVGTGTTIHVYYSIDRGTTWVEMLNSSSTFGFTTPTTGLEYVEYFIPTFDGSVPVSGRNLIYRVVSSDEFPCAILNMTPVAYVRQGKDIREVSGS